MMLCLLLEEDICLIFFSGLNFGVVVHILGEVLSNILLNIEFPVDFSKAELLLRERFYRDLGGDPITLIPIGIVLAICKGRMVLEIKQFI